MEDIIINSKITIPASAVKFKFSRSSGKGGQNVNKVSTKVELVVDTRMILCSEKIKSLITVRLQNKLDRDASLRIVSQESRSQWQNKQSALEKMITIIDEASKESIFRVPTKPTRSSKKVRVESKKKEGRQKSLRQKKFDLDSD